ncbi:MAG: hypothetical protein R3B13_14745 [Polyangiaceae bacterium]
MRAPANTRALALMACLACCALACTPAAAPREPQPTKGSATPATLPTEAQPALVTSAPSVVTVDSPSHADELPAEELTTTLRNALAAQDLGALANLVHPNRGVRLSPYAYVDPSDRVLTAAELRQGLQSSARQVWGAYDGSGEPIELDFKSYFQRFVSIPDPLRAAQSVDRALGGGNTVNNVPSAYPGARFIELHFPGRDPSLQGMDWQSVRFVFEKEGSRWWLVGIVHDEWTI